MRGFDARQVHVQHQVRGADVPDRPFVLKPPTHLGELPCLVEAFPGATVVNTHRDIDTAVASTCRIIELLTGLYTDRIDLELLGRGVLRLYSHDTARTWPTATSWAIGST